MTQTQHRLGQILLLACVFSVLTGQAKADIVKCTDARGALLITDLPCGSDPVTTRISGTAKKPPVRAMTAAQQRRFAETERARANAERNRQPAGRRLALDVATSAAARTSLQLIDQAWALQRQQALVEQEARPNVWAFWRS